MFAMSYLILAVSIIFNAASGVLLKYSVIPEFTGATKGKLLLICGYACGAVSALLYTKSLSNINLGAAATISAGLVIVVSNLAGILLFNESFSYAKLLGALLVCIGIYLVLK